MDKNYGVAYLDANSRGFSKIEPFVLTDFKSYDDAELKMREMVKSGESTFACVFNYESDDLSEPVTWLYAYPRRRVSESKLSAQREIARIEKMCADAV
jgi:hypothetical protein